VAYLQPVKIYFQDTAICGKVSLNACDRERNFHFNLITPFASWRQEKRFPRVETKTKVFARAASSTHGLLAVS